MGDVMSRDEVLKSLTTLIVNGSENAIVDEDSHEKLMSLLTKVILNQKVKDGLKENYLYSPLKSLFPLKYLFGSN